MGIPTRVEVLVVEDEVKLANALERGLARAGHAVDVILGGGKALTRLRN